MIEVCEEAISSSGQVALFNKYYTYKFLIQWLTSISFDYTATIGLFVCKR